MKGHELKPSGGGLLARAKGRLAAHDDRRVERTILKGRCAVTDKPFEAVFERKRGGDDTIFRFKEYLRPQNGGTGGPSSTPTKLDVPIDDIKLESLGCPHCKSGSAFHWVRCGRCKSFVCSGRSEQRSNGFYFRCGSSCGNEGITGELKRVNMIKPPKPTALQLPNNKKQRRLLTDQRIALRITDARSRK